MHDMHLKSLKSENSKYSLLKKDELPPRVKFSEDKDDGKTKLHKARWLRLPFVEPKEYYSQVIKQSFCPIHKQFVYNSMGT